MTPRKLKTFIRPAVCVSYVQLAFFVDGVDQPLITVRQGPLRDGRFGGINPAQGCYQYDSADLKFLERLTLAEGFLTDQLRFERVLMLRDGTPVKTDTLKDFFFLTHLPVFQHWITDSRHVEEVLVRLAKTVLNSVEVIVATDDWNLFLKMLSTPPLLGHVRDDGGFYLSWQKDRKEFVGDRRYAMFTLRHLLKSLPSPKEVGINGWVKCDIESGWISKGYSRMTEDELISNIELAALTRRSGPSGSPLFTPDNLRQMAYRAGFFSEKLPGPHPNVR